MAKCRPLRLVAALLERIHKAQEDQNKELLQPHAAQVDVQPRPDDLGAGSRARHDAAGALDDEADDVGQHEPPGDGPGAEAGDPALGVPVEHHARKGHVDKGVDPQRRKQEQHVPRGRVGDLLLVSCPEGVDGEADGLPEDAHDENPCVSLG